MRIPLRPHLLAATAAVLVLTGCGSDDATVTPTTTEDPTTATTPSSPATTPTSTGTTPEDTGAPATDPAAAEPTATITVAGGEVDGPGRVEVGVGDTVVLEVTSDTADEIHVHGYDVVTPVGAGETATVEFTADIPGVFEVELEESGLHLVELEIR